MWPLWIERPFTSLSSSPFPSSLHPFESTSKKVVVLGGAHHKFEYPSTPRQLWSFFSLNPLIRKNQFQYWNLFHLSLHNYWVFVNKVSLTAYLYWQLLDSGRINKLRSFFVVFFIRFGAFWIEWKQKQKVAVFWPKVVVAPHPPFVVLTTYALFDVAPPPVYANADYIFSSYFWP